jgi:two-component system cell cycle sensor histidine kinase/response regulator CckA
MWRVKVHTWYHRYQHYVPFFRGRRGDILMGTKPTYEELEQRVNDLEQEAIERKRAEEALRPTENNYKTLLETLPQKIFHKDRDSVYVSCNENYARDLKIKPEEIKGKTDYEFFPKELADKYVGDDKRIIASGKTEDLEERYVQDGQDVYVYTVKTPIRDDRGHITGILGIFWDITERKRSEEELRKTRDYLENLINHANAPIIVWDPEFRITRFNRAFERLTGKSADEALGRPLDILFPKDRQEEAMAHIRRTTAGERWEVVEIPILRTDGTVRIVLWNSANIYAEDGATIMGTIAQGTEITERKRAQEALQYRLEIEGLITTLSTSFIKLATDEIDHGINHGLQRIAEFAGADRSYVFAFYDNFTKMDNTHEWCAEGIEPQIQNSQGFLVKDFPWCEEIIKRFEPIHIPRVADPPSEAIEKKVFQSQQIQSLIVVPMVYGKTLSGFIGFDSVRAEKVWSDDIIALLRIVGEIFANALERKRAEEALRQSEERHRALFEGSAEGILVADIETKEFKYANPAIFKMLGYTEEELKHMSLYDLHPKQALEHVLSEFEAQARGSKTLAPNIPCIRKDGATIYADINTTKVFIDGRECNVGFFTDITERKHTEKEKKKLQAQVHHAQRLECIGILAGGIAHDFNNLLMGIQGNVSLMLMGMDSTNPYYRRLRNIEKQVQSGARLASQLLGYARKGRYEVKPVDLNQLAEATSATFGRTRKDIRIRREFAEDLSAIEADRGQMEQVLLNLFVNAGDAMPGGGDLILKTMNTTHNDMKRKLYDPKPGNYVLLTVTDTGIGMDKKTMERIFDPFFTTKEMGRGTGLGLASAYGIIEGHGGYIDVESKKGQGTTFNIYLPASEKDVQKADKTVEETIEGIGKVLLVDDEPVILDVGRDLLEAIGYHVLTAQDGKEAIEVYKKNRGNIDFVLLDMVMPGMGGGEAYARMKEINPDIKVLLSSGFSIDGQATEILDLGCDGFIQKPFNINELSAKIREILKKK